MTNNNLEENESELAESKELAETVGSALRGPKFGIFEQIICSQLIQASSTPDTLRKIQLITDSALMLDAETQSKLGIESDKLKVLNSVARALANNRIVRYGQEDYCIVKFGFNENSENFKTHIEPWLTTYQFREEGIVKNRITAYNLLHKKIYSGECNLGIFTSYEETQKFQKENKSCPVCNFRIYYPELQIIEISLVNHDNHADLFFEASQCLTLKGYHTLLSNFMEWANPIALELMRKLTESVKPEIYIEIARMFAAKEGEKRQK